LLEEDGGALRRPEEEHGVDGRHINALVEEINCEDAVDSPGTKIGKGAPPGFGVGIGRDRDRGYAGLVELGRHEPRVLDTHAETEGAHSPHVLHLRSRRSYDFRGPIAVGHVETRELRLVVATAGPRHAGNVNVVGDTEVLKRA
jgi:hypothetical protein